MRQSDVVADEMTARLLDGRFDVREGESGLSLHGERVIAERALSRSRSSGMGNCFRYPMLLLVHAEALHALGERAAACQAIREAQEDLLSRAAKIPDMEVRRSFLENFPDHRRTLELAREWWGTMETTMRSTRR